ncbi:hypothetical protein [Streptomyces sp. PR69]|uniref:hypothetical protein n=1 Tax=Streptomyces sp. PR69 TaxID=2984950 RepID=UPI0022643C62|nr:hypothetical protein [Streptomyces sp. PR69]
MNTGLTLAGLAASLAVLYANLRPWWKGGRQLKELLPFGRGALLGAVGTICTGGLLGWLAGCSTVAANRGGSTATEVVSGAKPTGAIARGDLGQLTEEGGVVVFLIAIVVVLAWREADKEERRRMIGGVFCGFTLCATAGVAQLLNWLPPVINEAGTALRGVVEGAGLL